jgi:hypothetical protein
MTGSNVDKNRNKTNADFYIDNMQICPAPPTVSYVTVAHHMMVVL